jgi:hypothetical protein
MLEPVLGVALGVEVVRRQIVGHVVGPEAAEPVGQVEHVALDVAQLGRVADRLAVRRAPPVDLDRVVAHEEPFALSTFV